MAQRRWRILGSRTVDEARSYFVTVVRRRLSLAAMRAYARHRLARVPWIGVPRAAVHAYMQQRDRRARATTAGVGRLLDAAPFFAHQAFHAAPAEAP